MDKNLNTASQLISQTQENQLPTLTPEARRLLLGASLRLLGHRFYTGRSILKNDVLRVAKLADDVTEQAA